MVTEVAGVMMIFTMDIISNRSANSDELRSRRDRERTSPAEQSPAERDQKRFQLHSE